MKQNYILLSTCLVLFSILNSNAQEFSDDAVTDLDSFLDTDADETSYSLGPLNNDSKYITSSTSLYHQMIYNNGSTGTVGRITVKSENKNHQKITPLRASSGEIITIKMKFKTKGTLVSNEDVFIFGLKSVLETEDTDFPIDDNDSNVKNGEWAVVNVDADKKLKLKDKTNQATEDYADANTCYVTVKYFIGDTRANSRIKMKLENNDSSSGWVDHTWTSQLLYDAITGSTGAYMIYGSLAALGSSNTTPHLYIDDYEFTTNDRGIVQLDTNDINDTAAWSTGALPETTDRLFIFDNTTSFLDSENGNKNYEYIYIDADSKLTIIAIDELSITSLDLDGKLDIKSGNFTEGNIKIGSTSTNSMNKSVTLSNTGDLLTIAPGGYVLRQSSMLCRYYNPGDGGGTGPHWQKYNSSGSTPSWEHDASFPDGSTDYSARNLVYTTQAHQAKLTGVNTFNDVYILDGKKMVIDSEGRVTVNSIYTQDTDDAESAILYTGASLIVNGTSTGNFTYNRYLGTTNWYLVSSPLAGETIQDLISNTPFASGSDNSANSIIGLSTYKGTDNTWEYMEDGSSGSIASGSGYAVKLSTLANVPFNGTLVTEDVQVTGLTASRFNLIGNPYTSYINAISLLDNNVANLSEQTIWIWNQAALDGAGRYAVYNNANDTEIMPAGGFFIKSSDTSTVFDISQAYQNHDITEVIIDSRSTGNSNANSEDSGEKTVQRGSNAYSQIKLSMQTDNVTKTTDIYYIEGRSTNFDNGWDSSMFDGVANDFAVYTQHVGNNAPAMNLAIQSLPKRDYESMVVPIGVHAVQGTSIEFSTALIEMPEGLKVFIHDMNDDSFNELTEGNTFKTFAAQDLKGTGRFYIHTTYEDPTQIPATSGDLSMYNFQDGMKIMGLKSETATFTLYNFLGVVVYETLYDASAGSDVPLPSLASGVYIARLKTNAKTVTKKIIIK